MTTVVGLNEYVSIPPVRELIVTLAFVTLVTTPDTGTTFEIGDTTGVVTGVVTGVGARVVLGEVGGVVVVLGCVTMVVAVAALVVACE